MQSIKLIIVYIFIILIFPFILHAKIYKYINEDGVTVYTDNLNAIPESQRLKIGKHGEEVISNKSATKLSAADLNFIARLKEIGLVDKNAGIDNVTREDLMLIRNYCKNEDWRILIKIKDMGIVSEFYNFNPEDLTDESIQRVEYYFKHTVPLKSIVNPPDPRFSSPEKTWELYKNSLIDGNFDIALQCMTQSRAEKEKKIMDAMGKNRMKEIAEEMNPIQKIKEDAQSAKYRIKKAEKIKGKVHNITYYIYFHNIYGNWKIHEY